LAIDRLVAELDGSVVEGLKSNRGFLARLADHPAFRAGEIDTGFIARHAETLAPASDVPDDALLLAALASLTPGEAPAGPFGRAFRLNLPVERTVRLWNGATLHALTLRPVGDRVRIAGLDSVAEAAARPHGEAGSGCHGTAITADVGGRLIPGHVVAGESAIEVRIAGQTWRLATRAPRRDAVAGASDGRITAPMPGRVLAVDVAPGQAVVAGERLLVLEAMKMEHRITALAAGTVGAVHVAAGDQVADGMLLVEIA